MYPTFTITDWVDQVLPLLPSSQRPLEVIQEPGDLMYRRLCELRVQTGHGDTTSKDFLRLT